MKKIFYLLPLVLFSCNNSSEKELQKLRDSLTVTNTETELKNLKDSIRNARPSQEEKNLMEARAKAIADSIAEAISASMNEVPSK